MFARWSATRVRPATQVARRMGQPRVDLPAPASEAADLGEHEAVRSEGPLGGERRRLWFGEHVHDLDDGDHGAVDGLRRWRHVRLIPQPVEGAAIELAAGVDVDLIGRIRSVDSFYYGARRVGARKA
jgi:hypothetical protein